MNRDESEKIIGSLSKDDILGYECKHIFYVQSAANLDDDLLVVKETIHAKDGRHVPRLRFVKNYKRSFYITKPHFRNHKDKRDWAPLKEMDEFKSTQRHLPKEIVKRLGSGNPKNGIRRICRSPYVYGADISTKALLKKRYRDQYPDLVSNNDVAVVDLEWRVDGGQDGDVLLATITHRDVCYVGVLQSWLDEFKNLNFEEDVRRIVNERIADVDGKSPLRVEFFYGSTPGEICKYVIDQAHYLQPDFVAIWNIAADIPKIERTLKAEGYDLAEIFSDPRVPKEYRYFKYNAGSTVRKKADGKEMKLDWTEIWNTVDAPATFFWIDPAVVYKTIRTAEGKLPSYALDYVCRVNEIEGKLYDLVETMSSEGTVDWHNEMVASHPVEYTVYNIYDCRAVQNLDHKVTDLCVQISEITDFSEYEVFTSNPSVTANGMHFSVMEDGLVLGTLSDDMQDDYDKLVQDKSDWIVTLAAYNMDDIGIALFYDAPEIVSTVYRYISDADIGATYPTGERIMNLSKSTTVVELCRVAGVNKARHRIMTVNLLAGPSNAIELMVEITNAPRLDEILAIYDKHYA
jgi:hypothetical protein